MTKVKFATRVAGIRRSFIREILKVTKDPEIISFAGGLPNPDFFPVNESARAAEKVLREYGAEVLQYSTTEGYLPLREYIAKRYAEKQGITVRPEEILITTGSQQGLDLIAKAFINPRDKVVIERPGYLGAIQAFSVFEPEFLPVTLQKDGIGISRLKTALEQPGVKIFYAVPNFQNPSGISYSLQKRRDTAALMDEAGTVLVEDDPYGEIRFMGEPLPMIANMLEKAPAIRLGTFSKSAAPGFRVGWLTAPMEIMEKLVTLKQASDLHTSFVAQRILYEHLMASDLDAHVRRVSAAYKVQRDLMVEEIRAHFPHEADITEPEGGMFLWVSLPESYSAMNLFERCIREKVAFVPGTPFYTDGGGYNCMRLNFSNSSPDKIRRGIRILGRVMKEYLGG